MTKISLNWRLIESYELDDLKKFKRLLILGASPNVPSYVDKWEESLLTRSIFEGKNPYAILLIDAGANLYDKLYRSSIIHAVVFQKNYELLRYLYKKFSKAELEIRNVSSKLIEIIENIFIHSTPPSEQEFRSDFSPFQC